MTDPTPTLKPTQTPKGPGPRQRTSLGGLWNRFTPAFLIVGLLTAVAIALRFDIVEKLGTLTLTSIAFFAAGSGTVWYLTRSIAKGAANPAGSAQRKLVSAALLAIPTTVFLREVAAKRNLDWTEILLGVLTDNWIMAFALLTVMFMALMSLPSIARRITGLPLPKETDDLVEERWLTTVGGTVVLTTVLGFFSGTALAILAMNLDMGPSILMGCAWSVAIFTLDTLIMRQPKFATGFGGVKRGGDALRSALLALFRLAVAVLTAFLISEPLVLFLFRDAVARQMAVDESFREDQEFLQVAQAQRPEIASTFQSALAAQASVDRQAKRILTSEGFRAGEARGVTGTGVVGVGPVARQRAEELRAAVDDYNTQVAECARVVYGGSGTETGTSGGKSGGLVGDVLSMFVSARSEARTRLDREPEGYLAKRSALHAIENAPPEAPTNSAAPTREDRITQGVAAETAWVAQQISLFPGCVSESVVDRLIEMTLLPAGAKGVVQDLQSQKVAAVESLGGPSPSRVRYTVSSEEGTDAWRNHLGFAGLILLLDLSVLVLKLFSGWLPREAKMAKWAAHQSAPHWEYLEGQNRRRRIMDYRQRIEDWELRANKVRAFRHFLREAFRRGGAPEPVPMPSPPPSPEPGPNSDELVGQRWRWGLIAHAPLPATNAEMWIVNRKMSADRTERLAKIYTPELVEQGNALAERVILEDLLRDQELNEHTILLEDYGWRSDWSGKDCLFLIMAYEEAETLQQRLERAPRPNRDEVFELVGHIAGTVWHLFSVAGASHRDIKPQNVLIDDGRGYPRLIDLGSATHFSLDPNLRGYTPWFAPPDAFVLADTPQRAQNQGILHDIYSIGALAFFAVTGRPPYAPQGWEAMGEEKVKRYLESLGPATLDSADLAPFAPEQAAVLRRICSLSPAERSAGQSPRVALSLLRAHLSIEVHS